MNGLLRDMALVTLVLAGGALVVVPRRPAVALGVVGGSVLVALSFWALSGVVRALTAEGGGRRLSGAAVFVKFFTRHAILALAAYVMMVRLHLDPVGMFIGVTSVVVAAAIAAARRQ